jgi:sialidase-1
LSFDGTDDFAKVEDSADRSLDMGARDFTIVAWVKTSSSFWNSDRFRVIVAKASSISYGDTKTNGWGLLIGSNNRLSLVLPGLNPGDFVSDAGTLSTDTWYHVAATYSAALDEATYYVNGKQLGVKKATSDAGNVDNNIDFRIGAQFDDGGLPIQGTLDDIRIYKRALTAEEVQALAAMP